MRAVCPAWSLSDEAFFYVAFLWVLPVVARWGVRRLLAAAGAAYALTLLAPALYLALRPDAPAAQSVELWMNVVKYNPLVRLPEFVLGVLAGRLFLLDRALPGRRDARLEVAAVLAIGAVLLVSPRIPYLLLHNGLLAPAFAVLVYALARGTGPVAGVLSTRLLARLGAASFALYILHVPLLAWLSRGYGLAGITPPPQPWGLVVFAGLSIAVSLLVFETVEEPGRRWVRHRLAPSRRRAAPEPAREAEMVA